MENIAPTKLKEGKLIIYQGNSLRASVIPTWFKPQVYGSLVGCLSWYESRNDPEAIGKAGEIGILQFTEDTFQELCVEKLNFRDDIWDEEIQKMCADYLLQDNWNYIYRWTTHKLCL